MKIFKRIYYSAIALLAIALLVFGILNSTVGASQSLFDDNFNERVLGHVRELSQERNSFNSANLTETRDYIVSNLTLDNTVRRVNIDTDSVDGKNTAPISTVSNVPVPTLVVQNAVVTQATQRLMPAYADNKAYVYKEVNNIIIYVPGEDTLSQKENSSSTATTADVVLVAAHYDSVSTGAMGNASSVAAILENIKFIIQEDETHKNDLLFVFTDAGVEGGYGAFALINQFKGFDNAVSRIKVVANFDMRTTSDIIMMTSTSEGNSALISEYTSINDGKLLGSVSAYIAEGMEVQSDFDAYSKLPALNFSNVGATGDSNTPFDNYDNINENALKTISASVKSFYSHFGNLDISDIASDSNASYFSYLGLFSVSYPAFVSYILAGVIAALFIAVIIISLFKKSFKLDKVGLGAGVAALGVVATSAAMFVIYFLVMLVTAGLGIVPLNLAASIKYMNPGLFISAAIIAGTLLSMMYILLKKAFEVKASDVARGNALLVAIISIVMGFAAPQIAYIAIVPALLSLAAMLTSVLVKDAFKAKFAMDIERLFLYTIPMIITLPLIIPFVYLVPAISGTVMLPLTLIILMLAMTSILPFASYLKPTFDKIALKLPKRTIRYEKEVTETVEDKAKKGKFTTVTSTKVIKEEVDRVYTHRFGVSVVSIIAFLTMVVFSCFGASFGQNLVGDKQLYNSVYDSAIVYVWENDSTGTTTSVEIRDQIAYKYFSRFVSDYEWNAEKGAYVKSYTNTSLISASSYPGVTRSDQVYNFTVFDNQRSQTVITLSNIKDIKNLIFTSAMQSFTYENASKKDEIEFTLPYGWGNFTLELEGFTDGATENINISYVETVIGGNSNQIHDVLAVREGFENDENILPYISSGFVLKYTKSL